MTREELEKSFKARGLPDYMMDGAIEYIMGGVRTGHFLKYLFLNDLVMVYAHMDDTNGSVLHQWVKWMYWDIPGNCWGSAREVKKWQKRGGLEGKS